jgi:hypothetical protein
VELGGGERHKVMSEGVILLRGNEGVRLEKALLVPPLGVNLCSGKKISFLLINILHHCHT